MDFGARLRELRQRLNLTQAELANKLGVSQSYVSDLERGKEKPSDTLLYLIAALFHVRLEWLIEGKGEVFVDIHEAIENLMKVYEDADKFAVIEDILKAGKSVSLLNPEQVLLVKDIELLPYLRYLISLWEQGDRDLQGWLKVQFKVAFPGFEEAQKKQRGIASEGTANGA